MIQKIKKILKEIKFRLVNVSYSQAGEDAILRFLFDDYGIRTISYLDIGTNSPTYGNNTFWFYKNGSRGVCVEADSTLIPEIVKKRPFDIVLNVGVSISNDTLADFYIFNQPAINTFDKSEAEKRLKSGKYKLEKIQKVNLKSINNIISDNFELFPDLLSLDIEGLDLDVLRSIDYEKYPIPVICVETCVYSENHIRPKDLEIINYLTSIGYFVYADSYLNSIFVNEKWFITNIKSC
jgi:FkbM family methyltransferase